MNERIGEHQQEALFKRLMTKNNNSVCADCKTKGAAWASLDFGVFVCINCSGIHRSFGMHITRIRSTKLDSWIVGDYKMLEAVGNYTANLYWEYGLRNKEQPAIENEGDRIAFVKSKYIGKRYVQPNKKDPMTMFLDSNYSLKAEELKAYFEQKDFSTVSKEKHAKSNVQKETHESKFQKHGQTHKNIDLLDLDLDHKNQKQTHSQKHQIQNDPFSFDFSNNHKHHSVEANCKTNSSLNNHKSTHDDFLFDFSSNTSKTNFESSQKPQINNGNIYNINNLTVVNHSVSSQPFNVPGQNFHSFDPYAILDAYKQNYSHSYYP